MSGKIKTKNWAELSDDEEEVVDKQNAEDTKNKGKSSYVKKDNDNNIVVHSQNNYKKHDFDRERVIDSLNKTKGKCTLTLFNISYDAKEQDIKNHYHGIKISLIEQITRGTFSVEFESAEEAIKCVNFKETMLKGRQIKMKNERDRKHEYEGNSYNSSSYFSKKTDNYKPRHQRNYNRREQYDEEEYEDYGYQNTNTYASYGNYHEECQEEDFDENYEDKNSQVIYVKKNQGERKPIGFIRREEKKNSDSPEKESSNHVKVNPFGEARPREEKILVANKEDEKIQQNDIGKEEKNIEEKFEQKKVDTYEEEKIKKVYSNEKSDYRPKKQGGAYYKGYDNRYQDKGSHKYYVPKDKASYENYEQKKNDYPQEKIEKKKSKNPNETFNRFDVLQNN